MSLENFIPEVWSARLLVNLYNALVYGQELVINRDYEGEIQAAGDTVRINSIGAVTVGDYAKNTDMSAPQVLSDAQTTLTITQQKFFNFQVDDIDKIQQSPKMMEGAMREAAYALSNTADTFIASQYTDGTNSGTMADGSTLGSDAAPIAIVTQTGALTAATENYAYEVLVDLSVQLDQNNVPETERWAIVPPWYEGYLLKDPRFVSFGTTFAMGNLLGGTVCDSAGPIPGTFGPQSIVGEAPMGMSAGNGRIGRVAGLTIFKSNNVPIANVAYQVLAGHSIAWSFAEQVRKVEAYRPEKRFADAVKGLHLYGAKVTRPQALQIAKVKRGAH